MNYNKKFLTTIISTVIVMVLIMGTVIVIDPYFHYHAPIRGIPYTLENDLYINAGVLDNFDYDSVIIGSSLASLMEPSVLDKALGTQTVLVTLRGASTKNGTYLMDYAIKHNKKLKNIYYSLDYHAITGGKDDLSRELPEYLYDDNPVNDTEYLLNKNTWIDGIGTLYDPNRETPITKDFDAAYGFDSYVQFSKQAVINNMPEKFREGRIEYHFQKYASADEFTASIQNIEPEDNVIGNITCNIIPMLEGNPNIQFNFYMAPIPILNWYEQMIAREEEGKKQEEILNQASSNLLYVFTELTKYHNCHLFFFYDDVVAEDMYRYTDLIHWDRRVGRYILRSIIDGNSEITRENKNERVFDFYKRVSEYNPNLWNGTDYPIQKIDTLEEYVNETNNNAFSKIVLINAEILEDDVNCLRENGYISNQFKNGKYYVSVINDGQIIAEEVADSPFEMETTLEDKRVKIVTKGYADEASIMIDDGEYCPEEEAIDIVVYDNHIGMVVDSVGVKSEINELLHY